MQAWMSFIAALSNVLWELFEYAEKGGDDPEAEMQLAMNIIRAAKDAQARREIVG